MPQSLIVSMVKLMGGGSEVLLDLEGRAEPEDRCPIGSGGGHRDRSGFASPSDRDGRVLAVRRDRAVRGD